MQRYDRLTSRVIVLAQKDIDTDQIIPARFLKVTDKAGLGEHLFEDWGRLPDGSPNPDFAFNRPGAEGAQILLAGGNFGCGSSREHAAWALADWGIRAVISTSFADIFRNNALKNGLLPVSLETRAHEQLLTVLDRDPQAQVSIDLSAQQVTYDDHRAAFPIDPFAKRCLLEGVDPLGYLLLLEDQIAAYEAAHAEP